MNDVIRKWIDVTQTMLTESILEVQNVRTQRDLDGLLNRFGWVRLALHDTHMTGWDAGDFTHGNYVEQYGKHINLNVVKEGERYIVEFSYPSPKQDVRIIGTTPKQLRSNLIFQKVFGKIPVIFRDHNTWKDVELNENAGDEPAFGHEVFTDGRTVWINASDGSNIARFGRFGIDVHNPITAQMKGAPQCLGCTHGATTLEDWKKFQELVKQHYDIEVSDDDMPKFLRNKTATLSG